MRAYYTSEGNNMKRKILASAILAALLSTTALADTSSMNAGVTGMGILENDYVRAGVNGTAVHLVAAVEHAQDYSMTQQAQEHSQQIQNRVTI